MKCVAHLLERRLPVKNAIRNGAGTISLELAKELLARGAEPDATAVLTATREGALEVAVAIARALFATRASDRTKLIADAKARAGQEEASAARVESGKMGSNMTPAEYRERANRYRTLAARLEKLER